MAATHAFCVRVEGVGTFSLKLPVFFDKHLHAYSRERQDDDKQCRNKEYPIVHITNEYSGAGQGTCPALIISQR